MRIIRRNRVLGAILVVLALLAAACGGDGGSGGDTKEGPTVIIGSFGFSESEILGDIYGQALAANGYKVEYKPLLGNREAVVNPALRSGEINFVPEYIGSALEVTYAGTPTSDPQATYDALLQAAQDEGFTVLGFTPAEDKNGIVVTRATADQLGLTTISDLKGQSDMLVFGGPPECDTRPRCLLGLQDVYGLSFAEFKPLDSGGPLTVAALAGGEIDVALLFTSDGSIAARDFVLLDDDLGLQPAENIAPFLSQDLVDAYGNEFVNLLNDVSAKISQDALTNLNKAVGVDGDSASDAAKGWLEENGFL